jgi:nucleotide-binding universal stress UspA family protein
MTDSASAPVIPADPLAPGGRIVVGVDDSDTAAAALRWALREGALRKAKVEVVHVWTVPVTALPFGVTLPVSFDESELDAAARDALDRVVDGVVEELGGPTPEIDRTVLPGAAAMTLVDVSAEADLLVVGSHGRTGWRKALLGSTAQTCVQHATCPVTVLRTIDDES